jgi:hypothetical protein
MKRNLNRIAADRDARKKRKHMMARWFEDLDADMAIVEWLRFYEYHLINQELEPRVLYDEELPTDMTRAEFCWHLCEHMVKKPWFDLDERWIKVAGHWQRVFSRPPWITSGEAPSGRPEFYPPGAEISVPCPVSRVWQLYRRVHSHWDLD